MLPIAGEPDFVDVLALLLFPVLLVITGYLIFRKSKSAGVRLTGSIMIFGVTSIFGFCGLMAYAIPALDDFSNPAVPLYIALIGNLILWGICLGAFGLAFHAIWSGIRAGQRPIHKWNI